MTAFAQRPIDSYIDSYIHQESFSPSRTSAGRRSPDGPRRPGEPFSLRKDAWTGVKKRDLVRTLAAAACAMMAFVFIVTAAVLLLTLWIKLWLSLVFVGLALAVAARIIMRGKWTLAALTLDSQESEKMFMPCSMW